MMKVKVALMQSSWDYQRLTEACTREGCILCRLAWEDARRYLEAWKYEMFTDITVREELRHSQGFCKEHTWELVQMGASIQLAQAYRDILSDAKEQLENEKSTRRQRWFEPKRSHTLCPACRQKGDAVARLISVLRQALLDPSFYTQFSASSGLCLNHFRLACELKPSNSQEAWLPLLRKAQIACLQRLDEQIGELIRKHDYRFRNEARGDEMVSWKKAAGLVAGEDERVY
ncbi:MAG TPA: DUF6062 family protein [Ktedonobacteraceae bacterium]|nr:DUF6062 family protein [Ktedonobacteraceae bacterium]